MELPQYLIILAVPYNIQIQIYILIIKQNSASINFQ
jgi:hypothetical protein